MYSIGTDYIKTSVPGAMQALLVEYNQREKYTTLDPTIQPAA